MNTWKSWKGLPRTSGRVRVCATLRFQTCLFQSIELLTEHVFCSTMSLSIFLGETSSDLLQPNAVKVDLDFDDDEIKVGVSFESDQSGDANLISKLDGIVLA